MGNFSSLFSNAIFFFYLLGAISFLAGLFLCWVFFFFRSADVLIILSTKKRHSSKSERKVITQKSNENPFKARRQEGTCSSLGRGQGMEQVTHLRGTRQISCHSMVRGKVN